MHDDRAQRQMVEPSHHLGRNRARSWAQFETSASSATSSFCTRPVRAAIGSWRSAEPRDSPPEIYDLEVYRYSL